MTSGFDLGHDLDLEFSRSNVEFIYLSQKWSDSHKTKSKHIDWTLGLKCDQRVWPWPWPWPWIFKVKYRICYISAKNGPIATKRKANILIELQASNVTNGMDLPDSDWGDFSCRRAVDSSSFRWIYLRNRQSDMILYFNNVILRLLNQYCSSLHSGYDSATRIISREGKYSLSRWTSYCMISSSLESARLDLRSYCPQIWQIQQLLSRWL